MITIAQVAKGIPFVYYGYDPCPWLYNEAMNLKFVPLYGPIDRSGLGVMPWTVSNETGQIVTGEPNPIGDKPCRHKNVSAELIVDPFVSSKVDSNRLMPVREGQFIQGTLLSPGSSSPMTFAFTHIVSEGSDISYSVHMSPYHASRYPFSTYEGDYYFRASMKDGVLRYGTGWVIKITNMFGKVTYERNLTHQFWSLMSSTGRCSYAGMTYDTPNEFLTSTYIPTTYPWTLTLYVLWPSQPVDQTDFGVVTYCAKYLSTRYMEDRNFLPNIVPMSGSVFGELSQKCANQSRYVSVNGISFIKELREIKSLIPKIGSLKNPKTWANAYLCLRYGLNLTVQDINTLTTAIMSAIQDPNHGALDRTMRASHRETGMLASIPYREEYHYKITTLDYPNPVMRVMNGAYRWGLYPTFVNLWDMVPFSFVLDWVVDVSSLLETIDTDIWSQYYTVTSVCRSRKVQIDLPVGVMFPGFPGTGVVSSTSYVRETPAFADVPTSPIGSQDFHNYVEATALIVQQLK